ncbi:MAG: hypothetical protein IIX79_05600 [Alistipes sp.]|nr:hypothetical protein [Alistipes sp.]
MQTLADTDILLTRFEPFVYSSTPYRNYLLPVGSEGHTRFLELAQEHPSRWAPWRNLPDDLIRPWTQDTEPFNDDPIWQIYPQPYTGSGGRSFTVQGGSLSVDGNVRRIAPAFSEALRTLTNTLDESYRYFPPKSNSSVG